MQYRGEKLATAQECSWLWSATKSLPRNSYTIDVSKPLLLPRGRIVIGGRVPGGDPARPD